MADLQFYHECDHRVHAELVPLNGGSPLAYPTYPLAQTSLVAGAVLSVTTLDGTTLKPGLDYVVSLDANRVVPPSLTGFYAYIDFSPYVVRMDEILRPTGTSSEPPKAVYVDYLTTDSFCQACQGSGLYRGAYADYSTGDLRGVGGYELCSQNMQKFLSTEDGANPFHAWVGTALSKFCGVKIPADDSLLRAEIAAEVRSTLVDKLSSVWKQVQGTANVLDSEIIASVSDITVTRTAEYSTTYIININVKTANNTSLVLSQIYEIGGQATPDYRYL